MTLSILNVSSMIEKRLEICVLRSVMRMLAAVAGAFILISAGKAQAQESEEVYFSRERGLCYYYEMMPEKPAKKKYGGYRKAEKHYIEGDSVLYLRTLKNAKGEYLIKKGNGYFYGDSYLLSFTVLGQSSYNMPYDRDVPPGLREWVTDSEIKKFDSYFLQTLENAILFRSPYEYYRIACGNVVNGYMEGEWLGLNDVDEDAVKHYSVKDTSVLTSLHCNLMDGYYDSASVPFYSYGRYSKGLKEGIWIYRMGNLIIKGEYRSNKREGLWVQSYISAHGKKAGPAFPYEKYAIKANYANDLLNGELTFHHPITGKVTAILLFEEGALIGPLLLTMEKNNDYVFFKGMKENGKIVRTFFTPKGDTMTTDMVKHNLRRYPHVSSGVLRCNVYEYQWNQYGKVIYELNKDKNCDGYKVQYQGQYFEKTVNTGNIWEYITLNYQGDTLSYKAYDGYNSSKPVGIWIRKDATGKEYTKMRDQHEGTILRRIENGEITIRNGYGFSTDHEGAKIYWENSKRVKRELKRGKEYLLEVYDIEGAKPVTYIDSAGKQTISNGNGFRKGDYGGRGNDTYGYFLKGRRVHKVRYDLYNQPGIDTAVKYTAHRTVTRIASGLYKVNYKLAFPYACGRAAVMDTFPSGVKILYASAAYNSNIYFGTRKNVPGMIKLITDDEDSCVQYIDETVWIEAEDFDISKVRGYFLFELEGARGIPLTDAGVDVSLKKVMAKHKSKYDPAASYNYARDILFRPNRSKNILTVEGFEVERTVTKKNANGEKYHFDIRIKKTSEFGHDWVFYTERPNTEKYNFTVLSQPVDYNSTQYSPKYYGQVRFKVFDKKGAVKDEIYEHYEFEVEASKKDFTSMGLLTVNGREYWIGNFISEQSSPLYPDPRLLQDEEYMKLINSQGK